ncbi:hypothetical protein GCM10025868_25360 [Angustibacter aerolatus]|uniref:HTH merR-type domain-containing protein n=1 Tax=Angustibacter aerolatus TaxID=1162965 RepID=A0ABQ6JIB6_9ACTN|nr:MerR family transcriptional regulator [Angustibacter aerolatus]GMA87286.1 hypothetical protein GCM10025868_25360 [Angustibacter aerolatus]
MHPQTLRQYDRIGLVQPDRARGRGRRYSARDVAVLREVQRLSQDEGVSLAGIKRILELESQVAALQARVRELGTEPGAGPPSGRAGVAGVRRHAVRRHRQRRGRPTSGALGVRGRFGARRLAPAGLTPLPGSARF